jgi:hypothetical protein
VKLHACSFINENEKYYIFQRVINTISYKLAHESGITRKDRIEGREQLRTFARKIEATRDHQIVDRWLRDIFPWLPADPKYTQLHFSDEKSLQYADVDYALSKAYTTHDRLKDNEPDLGTNVGIWCERVYVWYTAQDQLRQILNYLKAGNIAGALERANAMTELKQAADVHCVKLLVDAPMMRRFEDAHAEFQILDLIPIHREQAHR